MAQAAKFSMSAAQRKSVPNLYTFAVKGAALKPETVKAFPGVRKIAKSDGCIKAFAFQHTFGEILSLAGIKTPSVAAFWAAFNK
jgi:hypothetical protein